MKFRDDGFPLCPQCDLDELYSTIMLTWNGTGDKPTKHDVLRGGFGCYNCAWQTEKLDLNLFTTDELLERMEALGLETNLRQGNYKRWHCSWVYHGTFNSDLGDSPHAAIVSVLKLSGISIEMIVPQQ